jgi:hypothetical protein
MTCGTVSAAETTTARSMGPGTSATVRQDVTPRTSGRVGFAVNDVAAERVVAEIGETRRPTLSGRLVAPITAIVLG